MLKNNMITTAIFIFILIIYVYKLLLYDMNIKYTFNNEKKIYNNYANQRFRLFSFSLNVENFERKS